MIHHLLTITPSIESGLFTLGAAMLTGIFSYLGGNDQGKQKGRKEFIDAVERAAELVITRLETEVARVARMHQECEDSRTILSAQVEMLMKDGSVASYHINKDAVDG